MWARYADMVGTLVYMAPELMRRQASSPASDVFSLAICLNEMLTGCVPYSDVRSLCAACSATPCIWGGFSWVLTLGAQEKSRRPTDSAHALAHAT